MGSIPSLDGDRDLMLQAQKTILPAGRAATKSGGDSTIYRGAIPT
jgi:hypothetical protein